MKHDPGGVSRPEPPVPPPPVPPPEDLDEIPMQLLQLELLRLEAARRRREQALHGNRGAILRVRVRVTQRPRREGAPGVLRILVRNGQEGDAGVGGDAGNGSAQGSGGTQAGADQMEGGSGGGQGDASR